MKISHEGWEELVQQLRQLDDDILDKLDFEIFAIQMERLMTEKALAFKHDPASDSNVLPFRRNEDG